MVSKDSMLATSFGFAARSIPSLRNVVYKSYTVGFSRLTTSASMFDNISMSAMRGASAILSRSGASQRGCVRDGVVSDAALIVTSSVAPPPPYGSCCTVRSRRLLSLAASKIAVEDDDDDDGIAVLSFKVVLVAAMELRLKNNARGENPDADDDGSGEDVAMMARRSEMLNLMLTGVVVAVDVQQFPSS